MAVSVDTGSAFTIKELSGRKREVRLAGRALPYRPFTLKGRQRVEITWYGGNPEGTASVFGSALDPTKINGWWKDKYLGETQETDFGIVGQNGNMLAPAQVNNQRIDTAGELAEIIDSIRAEGQIVEVGWDQIVRHGLLSEFEQSWHNTHDLEWSIEFEWVSEGQPSRSPVMDAGQSITDAGNILRSRNDQLQASSEADFALDEDFAGDLLAALRTLDSTVRETEQLQNNIAINATTPFDAARRTIAILGAAASQAENVMDIVNGQPPRTINAIVPLDEMTLGQMIQAEAYTRGIYHNAQEVRRTAVIRQQETANTIQSDLLGTHTGREGEDLRDVSRIFYSTPFEWRRLLQFNELTSAELVPGQLVLVPRIPQGGTV